mmetsp:Transcript_57922/g.154357  ORF Transcript_57922/g.154357 Transcript_57922/m.154357 type:complete len:114 (-) Transcript_57922:556-897(-)
MKTMLSLRQPGGKAELLNLYSSVPALQWSLPDTFALRNLRNEMTASQDLVGDCSKRRLVDGRRDRAPTPRPAAVGVRHSVECEVLVFWRGNDCCEPIHEIVGCDDDVAGCELC